MKFGSMHDAMSHAARKLMQCQCICCPGSRSLQAWHVFYCSWQCLHRSLQAWPETAYALPCHVLSCAILLVD